MEIGIKYSKEIIVTSEMTALKMGSGDLEVFATPALIALMEGTAAASIKDKLDDGSTSVGTKIEIKHLAATPVDMKVCCESELIEVDGRRLLFKINVYDEIEKIGEGLHERFIVKSEKFQEKANLKIRKGGNLHERK